MTTVHNLQMLAVDLEERLIREMQLSGDAEKQAMDALAMVREGLGHLENVLRAMFQERGRALAATLGTGKPDPDTIDAIPTAPRKKVSLHPMSEA